MNSRSLPRFMNRSTISPDCLRLVARANEGILFSVGGNVVGLELADGAVVAARREIYRRQLHIFKLGREVGRLVDVECLGGRVGFHRHGEHKVGAILYRLDEA